jgi:small-conductance mechanosensitive channel
MQSISLENGTLWSIAGLIAGFAFTFIIAYFINKIVIKSFSKIIESQPKFLTTLTIMRRLIIVCVVLLGIMSVTFTAFPEFLGFISSIFVAAGFASIVIGLAAQSSLSNIISGIINSISQPFRIGDALSFRGEFCYVEDMRLMHTILQTWDNRRLVVPNSVVQNEVIVNYSMKDSTILVPVYVQISYESDITKAMQIMTDAAKKHPDCLPMGNLPNAVVMELQDSGIQLRLLSRAKDQSNAFAMTRDLLFEIKREFDAQNIEIPYPKRHLILGKELQAKISEIEGKNDRPSLN